MFSPSGKHVPKLADKTTEKLLHSYGLFSRLSTTQDKGGLHANKAKELEQQIIQKFRESEDNNKFLGGECDKWIEEIKSLETERDRLWNTMKEVKTWIDNWEPDFTEDDEWADTAKRVKEALKGKE